ncbi:hypothetical protein BS47DRAFT_1386747 [Hydnum rufescens UP504]|uniref:Uncharacterized protein n=1 Tax=Hydnum rufescens UP504 TaxID=1448309 RepID=A0A9P6BB40_9AGAM|nr:hypothetical protein BS47DRAFT_1386747 [Hydnum rufescens UP504]
MTKPSYFALVGIETLTLQELLACRARWNGLSPMDWTNPLEPEPPPSSGPSPLLNSDTTELTFKVDVTDLVVFVLIFFDRPWSTSDGHPPERVLQADIMQEKTVSYN